MSIRTKIFGVISIFLALACGLAAYGVYVISATGHLVVELYDGPLMGINHARAAHAELNQALLILQQGQSVEASSDAASKFEKLVQDIVGDLRVVRDRIQSPAVRPAQEQAESKVRDWSGAALKVLKPTPGGLTELPAIFTVVKLGEDAAAAVDDLVEDVAAYGFDFRTEAEQNVILARQTLVVTSIAGLLLGLVLAIGLAYSMSKPIKMLAKSMLKLADGDFEIVLPGVARADEVGLVARAVEKFKILAETRRREELESKVEQDRMVAELRRDDMSRIANDFEAVIGEIVKTVSLTSNELESSASTLTGTAERGTQLASTVATASEQASNNVQSVASATEELSSSVNEISRQVQHSARMASEAVDQARGTTERVSQLSQSATRIGDVVELINTIAGQTNLLALNATIEAARAGDAGRGFAVVALEVKALAEQTAKATGEIAQQILGIQTATQESVNAIRDISGTIEKLADVSSSIAAAVKQQGDATLEISRNIQYAAVDTQRVSSNIADVQHGATETGTASSKVFSAAQLLSADSHRLKVEVDTFLATVRSA
jgi:methyl-accepting chemotaxis protein